MGWFSNSKFAFCHGIANHAWQWPPKISHEGKRLLLSLDCANCTSQRRDRVNPTTGVVESRSYIYPEGYLLDLKGEKRPEKAVLRKEGLGLLLGAAKAGTVQRLRPRRTRAA